MVVRFTPVVALLLSLIATGATATDNEHVSKLEARRFRQACEQQAKEHGVKDDERTTFVKECFDGRVMHRTEARECRAESEEQKLYPAHRRNFMRLCIQEKAAKTK